MKFFKCKRPYDRYIDEIMGKGILRLGPWEGTRGPTLAHIIKSRLPPNTVHVKRMGWNDYVFANNGKKMRRIDQLKKHSLYGY